MKTCKTNRKRKRTQRKCIQRRCTQNNRSRKSTRSRKRRVRRNDMGRGIGSSKPKQPTPPITIYIKPSKNVPVVSITLLHLISLLFLVTTA